MINLTKKEWFQNAWERSKIPIKAEVWSKDLNKACSYYADDERPGCFIGVSLTPQALKLLEKHEVADSNSDGIYQEGIIGVSDLNSPNAEMKFFEDLQNIHDKIDPEEWQKYLKIFQEQWGI